MEENKTQDLTKIFGTLDVSLYNFPKEERRKVMESIIERLPKISGTYRDMDIELIDKGSFDKRDSYFIILSGELLGKNYFKALKEMEEFLEKLARKVWVVDVLVSVTDYREEKIFNDSLDLRTIHQLREKGLE